MKKENLKLFEPTEKDIQNTIIAYLELAGHFVYRNNSGLFKHNYTTKSGYNKTSMIRASVIGASDIIGCSKDGRYIAIEVKKPGKKPTVQQEQFLDEVRRRGGIARVATDINDVSDLIK